MDIVLCNPAFPVILYLVFPKNINSIDAEDKSVKLEGANQETRENSFIHPTPVFIFNLHIMHTDETPNRAPNSCT